MPEVPAFPLMPTKVLVPMDFSPSSQSALETAADLARHFHAELYLLHVIPIFPTTSLPDYIPEVEFTREARTFAEGQLAKYHTTLTARGLKTTSNVEPGNDVARSIIDAVNREHIDLVVISTHGISGWHPLVFGSIAEKVVKLVECPLLLLRSAKPETNAGSLSDR
jgi:nucleotide-binding universal stress UspA family protein